MCQGGFQSNYKMLLALRGPRVFSAPPCCSCNRLWRGRRFPPCPAQLRSRPRAVRKQQPPMAFSTAPKRSSSLALSSTEGHRCLIRWWQQMKRRNIYLLAVNRTVALPGSCSLTRHLLFAGIVQPLWRSPLLPADGGGWRCSRRFPPQQQCDG